MYVAELHNCFLSLLFAQMSHLTVINWFDFYSLVKDVLQSL